MLGDRTCEIGYIWTCYAHYHPGEKKAWKILLYSVESVTQRYATVFATRKGKVYGKN